MPESESLAAIRDRITRWHRTGSMDALWPDVPAADRRAAQADIRAATEAVLRSLPNRPTLRAATEAEIRALGVAGLASGMGALLGWWIEQGLVEASAGARATLLRHLDYGRLRVARLRAEALRVVAALQRQDLASILLKGLHTGAVYFPDPGTRPAADIDLLVHPGQRAAAAAALSAAGMVEARRTVFAARSEWLPVDAPQPVHSLEIEHPENPWCVDLHTALERWYFRGLRAGFGEETFANTAPMLLNGQTVSVLGQPHLTAFLALHASYELVRMQLIRLVELALVIRRDRVNGALDWNDLRSLLSRTGTGRFAAPGLVLVEGLAPGTIEPALLRILEASLTGRMRRVLEAIVAADMGVLTYRSLDDKLMWARGPRELVLGVSELVWPSDEGMPVGVARLYWRRLRALSQRRVGLRARRA